MGASGTAAGRRRMRRARVLLCGLVACAGLAGAARAQQAEEDDGGSTLMNLLRYGGTTKPPAAPPRIDQAYCPDIDVSEGGSVLPVGGGRGQIALGQLARECVPQADGSVVVKLGIQGRALLGPGGSAGRFEAPVFMAIKRNNAVVASRAKRVAVTVPPGAAQGSFTLIEDGFLVPAAAAKDYEIEIGLGGGPKKAARPARGRAKTGQPG